MDANAKFRAEKKRTGEEGKRSSFLISRKKTKRQEKRGKENIVSRSFSAWAEMSFCAFMARDCNAKCRD